MVGAGELVTGGGEDEIAVEGGAGLSVFAGWVDAGAVIVEEVNSGVGEIDWVGVGEDTVDTRMPLHPPKSRTEQIAAAKTILVINIIPI